MHKILENFDVTDLPSLPHVLVELVEACHRVDVTIDELAQCVEKDPTLAAMVLNFVGSRSPQRGERLSRFTDLIRRLGRNTLRSLAINAAAAEHSEVDPEVLLRFWRHAVRCAVTARLLAERTRYASPDEAYLAGLLHNIGELVLHARFPAKYQHLCESVDDDMQQMVQETEQFGISHAELGAFLIDRWNLNSFMADAARYHHQPEEYLDDAHPLVSLVHLAQRLSLKSAALNQSLFDAAERLFGLNRVTVMDLLARANQKVGELGQSLDLREATVRDLGGGGAGPAGKFGDLARKINDIALLGGVRLRPEQAGDTSALMRTLLQGAQILAGAPRGLCFLLEEKSGRLRGHDPEDRDALLPEFAIDPEGRSLIARSLQDNALLHSFEPDAPAPVVVDRQIMDRLGAAGLVCLPLRAGEARIGTLVLGLHKSRLQRLLSRRALLEQYAREATSEVFAARAAAAAESSSQSEPDARTRKIVHEVNNPLSIIRNYLQVLSIKLGSDHPAHKELKVIEEELVRASGLIEQLTRTDNRLKREPVSLNGLIEDLISLSQGGLLQNVRVDLDLDAVLPPIQSDRDALKQVLINLMRNAVEAMEGEGRLSIRTRDWFQVDGTPYVEMEVADTGPGLPERVQKRLFKPLDSDKPGHAGLGLSIVKQLIDSLEGSIGHRTGEGAGTSFRILLPRVVADERGAAKTGAREQELPEG